MADELITVNIVTPNSKAIEAQTDFVVCKLDEGEYGFLIGHTPLIGKLTDGFIRYNGKYSAIKNGIIDFNDNVLTCICQEAQEADSYEEALELIKKEEEKILSDSKRKLVDFTQAEHDLAKAIKEAQLGNFAK